MTPWTVAQQPPLSMEFSRQEYCSGLPLPSPGDLLGQVLNLCLLHRQADSLPLAPAEKPEKILRVGFLMGSLSKVSEPQSQLEMFVLKMKFKIMYWVGQRVHLVFFDSLWKTRNELFGQCDRNSLCLGK